MISPAASSLAKSGFRWRVQTVRKIIIDLNPTVIVGKCAGLFLCGSWRGKLWEPLVPSDVMEFLLGVAGLRSPVWPGRVISFENSLLPAQQRKWQREFDDPLLPGDVSSLGVAELRPPRATPGPMQWRGELCEPARTVTGRATRGRAPVSLRRLKHASP
jgi:hypothetical protein